MATDEQIERVRGLAEYSHGLHAEEALAAVLSELTTLRANLSSLVDSSIEPPRQVQEELATLRELRDAVKDYLNRGTDYEDYTRTKRAVIAALAKCQGNHPTPPTK